MKRSALLLALSLFPVWKIYNAGPDKSSSSHIEPISEELATFANAFSMYFDEKLKKSGCPGAAIAIVKGDQTILLEGYGVRNTRTERKVDTRTVFRLGSLSKGFAGVLVSKLVEEGFIGWDDNIRRVIPEFTFRNSAQADRINVRHLLSHSTGLQRHAFTGMTERGKDIKEIIPYFSTLPVYGKEGEFFAYQNAAFSMIEEIVYRKTNTPFTEWLQDLVFLPGNMQDVSVSHEKLIASENIAYPHFWNKSNRCFPARLNKKYYNAVSAGGINASISDMSAWLKILLGTRPDIISPGALDQVFTPVVRNSRNYFFRNWGGVTKNYYAVGWRVLDWNDQDIIYHGGSVNGFRSEIALDRKNNIGICVLFNSNHRYIKTIVPEFFKSYYKSLDLDRI